MKQIIKLIAIILLSQSACSQTKNKSEKLEIQKDIFISIDHIPIVVNDLEKIKNIFKTQLHFTIKEGKVHEGIKNCFVKFQGGTYLEFIEPLDSSYSIGKYYASFLKTRQGGTSLAISIKNNDLAKKMLTEKNIPFSIDSSNKIWQTIELENYKLFFIEYSDHAWKENPANTKHSNTATSLNSTYFLCDDINEEAKKYNHLGFTETEKGLYFEMPYKLFKAGQSSLYLLDGKYSSKINQLLNSKKLKGICGFEIKVNSLETFNKLVKQKSNVNYEKNRTTIYLKIYNIFLTFTE